MYVDVILILYCNFKHILYLGSDKYSIMCKLIMVRLYESICFVVCLSK